MVGLLAAARILAPWAGIAVLGLSLAWRGEAAAAGRPGAPPALARGFVLGIASLIVVPLVALLLVWSYAGGPGDIASLSLFSADAAEAERKLTAGLLILPIGGFLIARLFFSTGASLGCAVAIAAGSLLLAVMSWPVAFAGGLAAGALAAFAWDSLGPLASGIASASALALILADITAGRPGLVAVFLALDGGLALALLAARGSRGPPFLRLLMLTLIAAAPAFALLALGAHAGGLSLTMQAQQSVSIRGLVLVLVVLPVAAAPFGAAALMLVATGRRLLVEMSGTKDGFTRHPATRSATALGLFLLELVVSAALAGLAVLAMAGAVSAFDHMSETAGGPGEPWLSGAIAALRADPLAAQWQWVWAFAGCIFLPAAARLTLIVNRVLGGARRPGP
jgi:hypothetical protein